MKKSVRNSREVLSENANFYCTKCGDHFAEENHLDEHTAKKHENTGNERANQTGSRDEKTLDDTVVICGICAKGFADFNEGEKHMSSHDGLDKWTPSVYIVLSE